MTKRGRLYTEGWIEFMDKKIAKQVAVGLNSKQIGGKRRSRWFDDLWNIKYLHRFKWIHLSERLAYETEVRKQRMRQEISQAKKEASHYIQNVEKGQRLKRLEEKIRKKGGEMDDVRPWKFEQKQTDDEVRKRKAKAGDDDDDDDDGKEGAEDDGGVSAPLRQKRPKLKENAKKKIIADKSDKSDLLKSIFTNKSS